MENNCITESIIIDYVKNKLGCPIIGEKIGWSAYKVRKLLRKNGIQIRSASESKRKYELNQNYFEKIDSHEKAQILGFIAADGYVSQVNSNKVVLKIRLAIKDIDYLEWIKKCLGYSGPIRTGFLKGKEYAELAISSEKIRNDLNKLGIYAAKSLNLLFPTDEQVPSEFIHSYVRGYFEGDGSIFFNHSSLTTKAGMHICVTKEFGEKLKDIFENVLGLNSSLEIHSKYKKEWKNVYKIGFGGNKKIIKLKEWLYKDSEKTYRMNRKYERFELINGLYDENGSLIKDEEYHKKYRENLIAGYLRNGTTGGPKAEKTVYLKYKDEKIWFVTNIRRFAAKMQLDSSYLYQMVKGKKHSSKGWVIATTEEVEKFKNDGKYEEFHFSPPKLEDSV